MYIIELLSNNFD